MSASELYKSGKLQEAIDEQIKEVKAHAGDHGKRLFLFELLTFAGELDRAQRQIEVLKYDDMALEAALLSYRKLLESERVRRRLFSEGLKPEFLSPPPEHVNIRLEAVNRLREKNHAAALELLTKANAAVPEMRGTLNDKPFQGLRDADDLFAGMFEAFAHGKYFWVPFEQVESIAMKAPRFPRDILWVPARLETKDSAGDVFLPALYPNSHLAQDDQLRLGRSTDWSSDNNGPTLGVGLRLFLVGEDAVNLLEWRELKLES